VRGYFECVAARVAIGKAACLMPGHHLEGCGRDIKEVIQLLAASARRRRSRRRWRLSREQAECQGTTDSRRPMTAERKEAGAGGSRRRVGGLGESRSNRGQVNEVASWKLKRRAARVTGATKEKGMDRESGRLRSYLQRLLGRAPMRRYLPAWTSSDVPLNSPGRVLGGHSKSRAFTDPNASCIPKDY
jgi:hypothetical protein